jgi:hypothetical protein
MTVRVTFNQSCDRCERPFNQKVLKAGDKVPEIKSKGYTLYATTTVDGTTTPAAKPLIDFTDLCDGCREAVDKLVERIALAGGKKKSAPSKDKATPVAAKAAPVEAVADEAPPAEEKPKRRRGRPSKAEIAAREAAAEKTPEYTEPEPVPEPLQAESESDDDLGLAGDDNAKARETQLADATVDSEDAFPGHETFEDPDTGDVIDVHTGEVLAKRVGGAVKPVVAGKEPEAGNAHPF